MENRKDIGQAISDKLNSLDKAPREQVWIGIQEELKKKKKRRFAFFFFWTRIAAILLLGILATLYFYNENDGSGLNSKKDSNGTTIVDGANEDTSDTNNGNLERKSATAISDVDDRVSNDAATNESEDASFENSNPDTDGNSAKNEDITYEKNNRNINGVADAENSFGGKNNKYSKNSATKLYPGAVYLNNGYNEITSRKPYTNQAKGQLSKVGDSKGDNNSSNTKSKKKGTQGTSEQSKAKSKSNKKNGVLLAAQKDAGKKDSTAVDLSALQGKASPDLAAEDKTRKKDSVPVKKEKDLVKNINMYPKEEKDSIPPFKRFDFDVFASPTFYGYFNDKSTLDSRLDSLSKKSETKFSYGAGLSYELNRKITFRIGYRKINLSYVTENAAINVANYSGIHYNPNVSNESIYTASGFDETMDITQKISYSEVPFEFKYKFVDRKIGVKASTGFSFVLLGENSVSIKTLNGYSLEIGRTKDLNKLSMSFNLGLELDYPLFKNMKVFVEPMFNYQFNAFSNSDFKPYIFGIHAGLRYSFNN